ncbi:maleylpyruvate isomerase family mycothiol-dependent enzyme [Nonomuraea turkmeniaca]|uniref:Maleylpyruvate isomerase family mycothiol-dependent enzyme n=1 Tax=Nonomuraea turkmeniaca TaxID=103838 RepID=A0A5S4F8N9_9ACTN|nr:maleylpyruvate isomerase family mycothiol-dependent enzyme [Nonomuraea turkmeniaca]TMR12982.1 maleylpyruvate isomerase family mycothiol-dependent enzyme [Nonomuraea turkmeniaca]
MTVLPALQAELATATDRLLATAASFSDADLAVPSLLPGWTRGHVLAHVAQNAGSHLNLLTWARTGVRTPQYASLEARAAEIEAASARPASQIVAAVEDGAARLAAAVRDLPWEAWSAQVEGMRPPPHPAWYLLVRRLREVGFHHVDLDAGYGPADWPEPFVRRELRDCLASWPHDRSTVSEIILRDPASGGVTRWRDLGGGPAVQGTPRDMLAWLTGRSDGRGVTLVPAGQSFMPGTGGTGLPEPPPWLTMPAPADLPATLPKDY